MLTVLVRREAPLDLFRSFEMEHVREALRHLDLPAGLDERVVDDLGEDLCVSVTENELGAARKDGMRHTERPRGQDLTAARPLCVAHRAARAGERVVPARRSDGAGEGGGSRTVAALLDDRDRSNASEEGDGGKNDDPLSEGCKHERQVLRKTPAHRLPSFSTSRLADCPACRLV